LDGDDSVTIAAEAVKDYLIEHLDHLLKTEQIRSYQMFDTLMEGD
jgi:CRISPR/Cas system-associated protein Csm6